VILLQQKLGWKALQWEEAEPLAVPAKLAWVLLTGHFDVSGQYGSQLPMIRTVPGCIGVGEAIKGVAVAGFDGTKPGLLNWKAQVGMIELNQGTNAGEIKAVWVKWGTCSTGCQGNRLGCTIQVVDQAGNPGCAGCKDALAKMRVGCHRHSWWNDYWGWRGHLPDTGW
jgi:hypothetical protein